jgi:hypothetical protein
MPVVGEKKKKQSNNKSYMYEPIYGLSKAFLECAKDILNEGRVDIFSNAKLACLQKNTNDSLKRFFIEESADRDSMTAEQYDDHMLMMEQLYENDRDLLLEYTPMATVNPLIGTTLPLHKNLLMNNVFTQTNAIPKAVAASPKWTESMEYRYLVTPDGEEIDFYTQQHLMTKAVDATAPYKEIELKLPEYGETDMLDAIGASSIDNLSVDTIVSAVAVPVTEVADGQEEAKIEGVDGTYIWMPVNIKFGPTYGENERAMVGNIRPALTIKNLKVDGDIQDDMIQGTMNKNKITVVGLKGMVKAVKIRTRKDTSNAMLPTCSVKWKEITDLFEMPNAIPINVPISPEEIKDYAALYNINQLTKIMSMIKIVLENYKDDHILEFLDNSYDRLDPSQTNFLQIDWAPRHNYALDHVEWRHKVSFDAIDTFATKLVNILNDPNVTTTFFGRPDLIRKITPTEYSYESPKNIGPVTLEFQKAVHTTDNRTYQFISSQKFEKKYDSNLANQLICILSPKNTDRIIYKEYDYQMYVGNEIRNAVNYALPAVHSFERWMMTEYQPVQGRIEILNPTGIVEKPAVNVNIIEKP